MVLKTRSCSLLTVPNRSSPSEAMFVVGLRWCCSGGGFVVSVAKIRTMRRSYAQPSSTRIVGRPIMTVLSQQREAVKRAADCSRAKKLRVGCAAMMLKL